jgi:hypothetical protein
MARTWEELVARVKSAGSRSPLLARGGNKPNVSSGSQYRTFLKDKGTTVPDPFQTFTIELFHRERSCRSAQYPVFGSRELPGPHALPFLLDKSVPSQVCGRSTRKGSRTQRQSERSRRSKEKAFRSTLLLPSTWCCTKTIADHCGVLEPWGLLWVHRCCPG